MARPVESAPTQTYSVGGWFVAVVVLWCASIFRLFWDALACGDDGPADYGNASAIDYCRFLDRLGVFDGISVVFALDPGSIYFHLIVVPTGLGISALALRWWNRARRIAAAAAVVGMTLLVAAGVAPGAGYFLFYALPVTVAVGGAFAARARNLSLVRPTLGGAALTAVLVMLSFIVWL